MALKVIGAGYGRTGTFALKRGLDQLGFGPCHHMYEVRKSTAQVDMWLRIAAGETMDWDTVFDGFGAQVDWPGTCFWRDLIKHYPDAKVILTDRDPESWFESVTQTIVPASIHGRTHDRDRTNQRASDIIYQLVLEGVFGGKMDDRATAIAQFNAHRQEVIDTVPAERLLIYQVGEGWGRLCDFLGVPEPEGNFPRGNTIAEFRAMKPYFRDI